MRRHWRWLLLAALTVGAVVPLVMGGPAAFHELARLPLSWLLGMLALIGLCWNLNAWRLRLMLNGRAPGMGHGSALATVMVTEFSLNATPGGSGAPFTLAALLSRHGVAPARATAVLAVGWEVLVANVGDSDAWVDTGAQVLRVSANHRLDDSPRPGAADSLLRQ